MSHVKAAPFGWHFTDCPLKIIQPSLVPWWQLVLMALDIYRASTAVLILLRENKDAPALPLVFVYEKASTVLAGIFGVAESEFFVSYESDFMVIACSIRHS